MVLDDGAPTRSWNECATNPDRVRVPLASLKPEESARLPDMKPCIPVRSRSRHSSALNLVIIDPDLPISIARQVTPV